MTMEQKKSILIIKNYLNRYLTDDYIMNNYEVAVDQLIENATKLKDMKVAGVKSMSEGNQSISFEGGAEAWSITNDVKALLPVPSARMW